MPENQTNPSQTNQSPPDPNPPNSRWLNEHWREIIVTLIGAFATIFVAIITEWIPPPYPPTPTSTVTSTPSPETQVSVHVSDSTGSSVVGAKVLLFFQGGSPSQQTDSDGMAHFNESFSGKSQITLIVEHDQYQSHQQLIGLPLDKTLQVQLKQREGESSSITVRVVDDESGQPLDGAEVLLMVEGEIYSEYTNSNGIVKLTVPFVNDHLDANMSISTNGYEIQYQNVTLVPDKVQDVRLTKDGKIVTSSKPIKEATEPPLAFNTTATHTPVPTVVPPVPPTQTPLPAPTPCPYQAGTNSSFPTVFQDAYNRHKEAKLGCATNETHWWEGLVIQDFDGGSYGHAAIFHDENKNQQKAYVLWGRILHNYWDNAQWGPPQTDVLSAWPSPYGTSGYLVHFSADLDVYTSPHGTYVIRGATKKKFDELNGTGGDLGFPISGGREITSSSTGGTQWEQLFEGGKLITYEDEKVEVIPNQ